MYVIKTKVVIKDKDVTEGSIVNWLTSEDWAMSDENKPLEFPLPGGLDCPAWCGPPLDSLVTCVTWSWNTQWITAVSQETVAIAMVDHGVNVPCPGHGGNYPQTHLSQWITACHADHAPTPCVICSGKCTQEKMLNQMDIPLLLFEFFKTVLFCFKYRLNFRTEWMNVSFWPS